MLELIALPASAMSDHINASAFPGRRNETRLLRLMSTPRVNSGTAFRGSIAANERLQPQMQHFHFAIALPILESTRESRTLSDWQPEIFRVKKIPVGNVSSPLARSRLHLGPPGREVRASAGS